MLINTTGDARLRLCDYSCRPFLFGIAMVPVTHILHPINAKNGIFAKARDFVEGLRFPTLAFAYA